jgi:hypothetical protein
MPRQPKGSMEDATADVAAGEDSAYFGTYAAEGDGSDAEIGGEGFERKALKELGVTGDEVAVAVGGLGPKEGDKPFFGMDELLFGEFAAPVGKMYVVEEEAVEVVATQTIKHRGFHEFDGLVAWLATDIAFQGDEGGSLLPYPERDAARVGIGDVGACNAFAEEIDVGLHPAGLQEEMAFGKRHGSNNVFE